MISARAEVEVFARLRVNRLLDGEGSVGVVNVVARLRFCGSYGSLL